MTIFRGSLSNALLLFVKAKKGCVENKELRVTAHAIARSANAGNNALKRLIDRGHLVIECRITEEGEKELQEAMLR